MLLRQLRWGHHMFQVMCDGCHQWNDVSFFMSVLLHQFAAFIVNIGNTLTQMYALMNKLVLTAACLHWFEYLSWLL